MVRMIEIGITLRNDEPRSVKPQQIFLAVVSFVKYVVKNTIPELIQSI